MQIVNEAGITQADSIFRAGLEAVSGMTWEDRLSTVGNYTR